jgi:NAD(P)-dependent dehydrogenase (short-subunit alcohol dehydrogenase family)
MSDLRRRCVVIGYGPGLGAALARGFAAAGFGVLALARNPATHAHLAGDGIELRAADAGDLGGLSAALSNSDPEVLIFNAYKLTPSEGGPSALDPAALMDDFRVNVAAPLAAARAVLPGMLRRGHGTILFTGGGLALNPTFYPPAASLAASKAALRNLTQGLHAELAPKGIHVATVTITGFIRPGTKFDPDRIAAAFLDLHGDAPGAFRAEIMFDGS